MSDGFERVHRPDDDEILRAIGRATVAGANLERAVRHMFLVLATEGAPVHAVLLVGAGQNFAWLVSNCRALVKEYFGDMVPDALPEVLMERIQSALLRADEAWAHRNHIVHGVWHLGTGRVWRSRYRTLLTDARCFSVDDVNRIADELERCELQVFGLAFEIDQLLLAYASS